jgi:hypothetical protein
MAASFRASTTSSINGTNNFTIALPSGTTSGDLMVALVSLYGTSSNYPSCTTLSGWTLAATAIQNSSGTKKMTTYVFYKVAGSEPSSYSWTTSNTFDSEVVLMSFYGVQGSIQAISSATAVATSLAVPSQSPAETGAVLLALFGADTVNVISTPSGMTSAGNPGSGTGFSSASALACYQVLSSSGSTGTRTSTDSGTDVWLGYSVLIAPTETITLSPSSLPAAANGSSYSQTITASGGTSPYSFAVTSGSLPTGLSLSSGGVISGTPTVNGSSTFTVTATDAIGQTGSRSYTIVVETVSITTTSLPGGVELIPYSQTLSASGGTAPYTWAITSGSLPPGLALSSGGVLSGTPTQSGFYTFSVTATDSLSLSASYTYSLFFVLEGNMRNYPVDANYNRVQYEPATPVAGQCYVYDGVGLKPGFPSLRNFRAGLTLANNGSGVQSISISPGQAVDSTNAIFMSLGSTYYKTLASAWASGAGSSGSPKGGLDTGSVAANTWYHVFLIYGTSGTDVLFTKYNSSGAALPTPTLPSGYTYYRRIGSILTDGSSNVLAFTQVGHWFWWAIQHGEVSGSSAVSMTALALNYVPPNVYSMPNLSAAAVGTAGYSPMMTLANGNYASGNPFLFTIYTTTLNGGTAEAGGVSCLATPTSSGQAQIYYYTDGYTGVSAYVSTNGYYDLLGEDQ